MQRALSGVSVVELGEGIAPAYCGKLLADLGADVVKVDVPGRNDGASAQDRDGRTRRPLATPAHQQAQRDAGPDRRRVSPLGPRPGGRGRPGHRVTRTGHPRRLGHGLGRSAQPAAGDQRSAHQRLRGDRSVLGLQVGGHRRPGHERFPARSGGGRTGPGPPPRSRGALLRRPRSRRRRPGRLDGGRPRTGRELRGLLGVRSRWLRCRPVRPISSATSTAAVSRPPPELQSSSTATLIPTGVFPCADGYVALMSTAQQLNEMLRVLDDPEATAAFERPDAFERTRDQRSARRGRLHVAPGPDAGGSYGGGAGGGVAAGRGEQRGRGPRGRSPSPTWLLDPLRRPACADPSTCPGRGVDSQRAGGPSGDRLRLLASTPRK